MADAILGLMVLTITVLVIATLFDTIDNQPLDDKKED
jgi:hypothetical protein